MLKGNLKKLAIAGFIVAVLLSLAGLKLISEPYKYRYNKLDTYSLPGFLKGSGMTFSKPQEADQAGDLPETKDHQLFTHSMQLNDKKNITLFYEAASSEYNFTKVPYTQKEIEQTQQTFLNSSSKDYASYNAAVNKFISYHINPRYKVTLGNYEKFKSNNIKQGGVVAEIRAIDTKPTSSRLPVRLRGEVIFATGANGYYYFYIAAIDYNWNTNKNTWSNILGTVKIDQ